jgi:hypothetical protein
VFVTTDEAHCSPSMRERQAGVETEIGNGRRASSARAAGSLVGERQSHSGTQLVRDVSRDEKCFISAYDAATGKLVWKFNTIARSNETGGDSWGRLPDMFRAGTESWITAATIRI